MPAFVLNRCARYKHIAPTASAESKTQVYVLEIHEEPVIKPANIIKCCSPHEDARAT